MNENEKKKTKFTAVEITPVSFQCTFVGCPSVFDTDMGTFILVGKTVDIECAPEAVKNKVGVDETAIEIPKELINELFSKE